jgi:hypothetical protein
MIQIDFTFDRREVVFIKLRRFFTRAPILGMGFWLLVLIIMGFLSHSQWVRSCAITATGFVCLVIFFIVRDIFKSARAVPLRPTTLTWDDSRLTLSQDGSRTEIEWRRFSGWAETSRYFIVRLGKSDVSLPKRSFSAEALADFRTCLQRVKGQYGD